MAVERIYYCNKNDSKPEVAKKQNKKIADLAKLTVKLYSRVEVFSESEKSVVSYISDTEEGILPGWNGVDFTLDEFLPSYYFEKSGLIKRIEYGKSNDGEEVISQIII